MGKREKLIERLTNSPQNATFADIRNLLEYEGFYLDRVTGSHQVFKYAETTFVIPVHNNRVKAIYVRKVLELIASADIELDEEEE
ncbi:type II toxin-antitoxin system HicA family toxin [Chamaesiphon polymorphus]|uniref:Type II toxin-antitoxin system HicA family toxin n=1 Tax=Chamaesiphon polymorphus CCALA 037 TaxID=2107692 RepID=A0A2T1GJE9_9CYAN|nr:type II toxin-antitoxin system HicA family toxin [Chamaesiphon polymorphus]PSB57803.1 type II toxin-antitoxin system HicA family toxin [Chamaesiphon polymorphus CCALA 037]